MRSYIASILVTVFAIGITFSFSNSNQLDTRACIFFGGLWWLLWSCWTFRWLGVHPCQNVPESERIWLFAKGWISTARTLKEASNYPETMKFLVAYFFYSDSYSTIATVGILIFQDVLCMSGAGLLLIVLEVMILAIVGNVAALKIQVFACEREREGGRDEREGGGGVFFGGEEREIVCVYM